MSVECAPPQRATKKRDLVSIDDLSKGEILALLTEAERMRRSPPASPLQGKVLASCFFEPSTRTRLSFEAAMIRLGGSVIGFAEGGSTSAQKGESLSDAMRVIGDLADVIVIRHPREGAARLAADVSAASVINGGDGSNQHPSQTLLDLFTIREAFPEIDGLHVAIAGDLKYGRTVHSLVLALAHFRVRLFLISSSSLQLPDSLCSALRKKGVKFSFHSQIEEVLSKADLLYMTRIQKERFAGEAVGNYRLKKGHLLLAKPHLKILHPLPRIDEIDREIDETPHALYFRQAAGGLFVRMALLYRLLAPPIDGEER